MTLNLQIHGTNSSILTANIGPNAFQHTELNMTQQFAWVCEKKHANVWTPAQNIQTHFRKTHINHEPRK